MARRPLLLPAHHFYILSLSSTSPPRLRRSWRAPVLYKTISAPFGAPPSFMRGICTLSPRHHTAPARCASHRLYSRDRDVITLAGRNVARWLLWTWHRCALRWLANQTYYRRTLLASRRQPRAAIALLHALISLAHPKGHGGTRFGIAGCIHVAALHITRALSLVPLRQTSQHTYRRCRIAARRNYMLLTRIRRARHFLQPVNILWRHLPYW